MENFAVESLSYDQLSFILEKIVSSNPNTEEIKKATDLIKKYSKHLSSVEGLILQIKSNQNFKIRQLSAIVLYKKLEKHWLVLEPTHQVTLKNLIVELYLSEKNYLVLKAISNLLFKLAKLFLINKEWNDLLDFIFSDPQRYSADQANLFELNLHVISELINICSIYLKHKLNDISKILETSMTMGNQKMKENATKCLGNIVRNLEKEELFIFKNLIPLIFSELKNFSEETILHIYETLCDFHINSLSFFDDFFIQIIPLTYELLLKDDLNGNTKTVLSEFLMMIGECKKKIYTSNSGLFLRQGINISFKLAAEGEDEDEDMNSFKVGMTMLSNFSLIIQSKYTFPLVMEEVKTYLSSSNPNERKAAISALGHIAEGCNEKIKENLEEIVTVIVNAFNTDPDSNVKGAAIIAMDLITQFCASDINEYHDKIMPMLISGLYSTDEEILEKSLIELNFFCRNLDLELEEYLNLGIESNQNMLARLILLLTESKNIKIQEQCLFALSSIIGNAQNVIHSTLFPIVEILKVIITTRCGENENALRANALDCVAHIAFVIKIEQFQPYEQFFTTFAFECVKSSIYEFQEAGFSYFSTLASILGHKFSSFLDVLMNYAFIVLKDNSGIYEKSKGKDEYGLDSDSESEDGEGKINDVYFNEEFMDAKSSVIIAISSFAKSCPKEFLNYLKDVFVHFETFWESIYENVVVELIEAYSNILIALGDAENQVNSGDNSKPIDMNNLRNMSTPTKVGHSPVLSSESIVIKFWSLDVFPKFESIILESENKEHVAKALESIYEVINHYGRDLFQNNNSLERLISCCKSLLNFDGVCQIKNDDPEEEDLDHDEQILTNVESVFLILAEKLEDDFHPYFVSVFPDLKKLLSPERSESDRSLAFGCIADVLKFCKISTKFFVQSLNDSINANLSKKLKKKNEQLLRHIAFLIGVLFESDAETSRNYLNDSLSQLQKIYTVTQKDGKDNVIGALSKIVLHLGLTLESSELFPKIVENIFDNIPLNHDTYENISIFKMIMHLSKSNDITNFYFNKIMDTLKMIVLKEIKCGTSKENIKEVKAYLEHLNTVDTFREKMEDYLKTNMTEAERERFVNSVRNA